MRALIDNLQSGLNSEGICNMLMNKYAPSMMIYYTKAIQADMGCYQPGQLCRFSGKSSMAKRQANPQAASDVAS
jgi:hypothetical protein